MWGRCGKLLFTKRTLGGHLTVKNSKIVYFQVYFEENEMLYKRDQMGKKMHLLLFCSGKALDWSVSDSCVFCANGIQNTTWKSSYKQLRNVSYERHHLLLEGINIHCSFQWPNEFQVHWNWSSSDFLKCISEYKCSDHWLFISTERFL